MLLKGGYPAPMFDAIVGAPRCTEQPARCDLTRGIATDDRSGTVTIRLRRPDPDLLWKLALPLTAVVPASTPRRVIRDRAPLGTGPYRIERFVDGRSEVLVRNPHFRSRGTDGIGAGFADRIEVTQAPSASASQPSRLVGSTSPECSRWQRPSTSRRCGRAPRRAWNRDGGSSRSTRG